MMTATDNLAADLYLNQRDLAAVDLAPPGSDAGRPRRAVDPDRVLTDDCGRRVPSRMGAVEWARDSVTEGTTPVVATAMAIALRLDDTLICWPTQRRLASDIRSKTDKTIYNACQSLQSQGLLAVLYLWRGEECSGCVYVLNLDGWLDDIIDDRLAVLRRVAHVRARAFALELRINRLPEGTDLSARPPGRR